jgi:transposase
MQDKELYQQILGLSSPWSVQNVELDVENSEIRVNVSHPPLASFCCPECQASLACHDHAEERRWRHLDSCQFQTILTARVPRVKCPEHGVKHGSSLEESPIQRRGPRFRRHHDRRVSRNPPRRLARTPTTTVGRHNRSQALSRHRRASEILTIFEDAVYLVLILYF